MIVNIKNDTKKIKIAVRSIECPTLKCFSPIMDSSKNYYTCSHGINYGCPDQKNRKIQTEN